MNLNLIKMINFSQKTPSVRCVEEELEDTVTTEEMCVNHAEPSSEGNYIFSIVIAQVNIFLHISIDI